METQDFTHSDGKILDEIMVQLSREAHRLEQVKLPSFRTKKVMKWRRECFEFMKSYMQVREGILKLFRDAGHPPTIRVAFPSFDIPKQDRFAQKTPLSPLLLIPALPLLILLFPLIFPLKRNFDRPHIETKKKLSKIAQLIHQFRQSGQNS